MPGLCLLLRPPAEQTAQPVAGLDEDHGDRIRKAKDTAVVDGRIRLSHAGRDGQPAGRPVEYLAARGALPGPERAAGPPGKPWRAVDQPASPIRKTAGPSPPTPPS